MKAPPYFPFFQRDFVHSVRTARMTAEEVGTLVMVMCQQWEEMGPIAVEPERFSAYTGWDIRVARRLLARLVSLEKVDQSEAGIQSVRMAEEITKYCTRVRAAEARETAKKLEAERAFEEAQIRITSAELLPNFSEMSETSLEDRDRKRNEINERATTEAPLPDIRYQKVSKNPPIAPQAGGSEIDPIPKHFEEWWQAYPKSVRKVGKGECLALYRQAVTGDRRPGKRRQKVLDHGQATPESLLAAVKRYAATKPDPQFTVAPARWFNEARWLDDPDGAAGAAALWWEDPTKVAELTPDRWREGIAKWANGVWPLDKLGPPPGRPECIVPRDLVDELRLTELYTEAGMKRR